MASQGLLRLDKLTGIYDQKKMTNFYILEAKGKWSPSKKTTESKVCTAMGEILWLPLK